MYEFIYHVKFRVIQELLDVKIFLSLEDLFTPVYIKTYEKEILKDKKAFQKLYTEIKEYFTDTNIIINEADLKLLYQTIVDFSFELPKVVSVVSNQYDEELDQYRNILTPKEIVFIKYAEGKAFADKRFLSWELDNNLGTEDLIERMLKKRLITADNYLFNLTKAKRDLLLDVVSKYELDVYGDNGDLIRKIQSDLAEEQIRENFSGTHLSLTSKGKKVVEMTKKLHEFNRSFFRTINKLSLEEFHILSIKKEDYDFNGLGRLLMINNNYITSYFDWDKLNEERKEPVVMDIPNEDENDSEFIQLIEKISHNVKAEELKIEAITDEVVIDEMEIDDVFIDDNLKVNQQLETYRQKRELYEKNKDKNNNLYSEEVYGYKKRHFLLKFMIILISVFALLSGLLFLNEKLQVFDLPFTLKDIFVAIKETFENYIDKLIKLFK